jgi:hypothetical protein
MGLKQIAVFCSQIGSLAILESSRGWRVVGLTSILTNAQDERPHAILTRNPQLHTEQDRSGR